MDECFIKHHSRVSHGLCSLFRLLLLSLLLSKELSCLVDLLPEIVEVADIALDLFKREIDEHICDLRCQLFSNEFFNVLVNELSNLLLDIGVVDNDTWEH